jgi:hypothetical protein
MGIRPPLDMKTLSGFGTTVAQTSAVAKGFDLLHAAS